MTALAVSLIGTVVFLLIWHFRSGQLAGFIAVIAACSLTTTTLFSFGGDGALTAMADPDVTFATFNLALLGAFLAMPFATMRSVPIAWWFFILSVVIGVIAGGLSAPHVWSGALQWATVVFAWGIGGALALGRLSGSGPSDRSMSVVFAIVVGWHGVTALLQAIGVRAVSAIESGDGELTRVSGLAGHSGNLGKIMFCLVLFLLPLTRSSDRVARRLATGSVVVAVALTGVSFSRANTLAVFVLVGLWLLLGPGLSLSKRLLIPAVALVLSIPILDVLIQRNQFDPEGGLRPVLLETAVHQIGQTFWFGVGPNNYLNIVGQYDPFAAGGLPVHSALLLALAELGFVSVLLLALPLVWVLVLAARSLLSGKRRGTYSVLLLAAAPGVYFIASTGWGILREQYLILLFFALGYLAAGVRLEAQARGGAERSRRLSVDGSRSDRLLVGQR